MDRWSWWWVDGMARTYSSKLGHQAWVYEAPIHRQLTPGPSRRPLHPCRVYVWLCVVFHWKIRHPSPWRCRSLTIFDHTQVFPESGVIAAVRPRWSISRTLTRRRRLRPVERRVVDLRTLKLVHPCAYVRNVTRTALQPDPADVTLHLRDELGV